MNATIYDPVTGEIKSNWSSNDQKIFEMNLRGATWIPGDWSGNDYYVANGRPIPKPTMPSNLGYKKYQWDPVNKTWQLDVPATTQQARQYRDRLLSAVDRVNPLWYADLGPDRQAELAAYRSALLAVPEQAGFPEVISWPAKPRWL